ncbi:cytochrome P450 [Mycobacterium sp. NPDC049093]
MTDRVVAGAPPPQVRSPSLVQKVGFVAFRRTAMRHWIKRHGHIFEISAPVFGRFVVVSDPALVRSVCTASAEQLVNVRPNLGSLFGPGSIFALDGDEHRDRRRLIASAFHRHCLKDHEKLIEDETLQECANWPEGKEFRTLEPMERITLNMILRAIFGPDGADGSEAERLREVIPLFTASRTGRWIRWGRLNNYRRDYDRIVTTLIDRAEADPGLGDRDDVLAVLLRSRHDDGTRMSRRDICDELLAFIGAGQETTAAALAWAFERLRRHPSVLAELVREIDAGGSEVRRATIVELLRTRTVVDVVGRRVRAPYFSLGEWRIPQDRNVLVRVADLHEDPENFPHPERFEPRRFLGIRPTAPEWLAFGGGVRRCPAADFAMVEIDVVLRTVLRDFRIQTDTAADEKPRFRGIAHVPGRGGRIVLHRRTPVGEVGHSADHDGLPG